MHAYPLPRYFDKFWVAGRVKNTLKMTFLPLFGHTGSSVGKTHFWRGKWQPNSEIPLGLESRQADRSNELSYAQFGHREGLQNRLQSGMTHREFRCGALGILAHFSLSNSVFCLVLANLNFLLPHVKLLM